MDKVKHDGNQNKASRTRVGRWDSKAIGLPFFNIGFLPYGALPYSNASPSSLKAQVSSLSYCLPDATQH